MPLWIELLLIICLFLAGLRLSAFFSGTETAYYRMSVPRVMIDAQAGDRTARYLQSLAKAPSLFMAGTLVGNNLANYVLTLALGMGVTLAGFGEGVWTEIAVTLCSAPVIFVLGELLPKNVYYRAPLHFLRKDAKWLRIVHLLLLPASWPLHRLTRLIERLRPSEGPSLDVLLGRNRLAQVMSHGHREGVLTAAQIQLATGLLHVAPQPVTASMIPADRMFGVDAGARRDEILKFARQFGVAQVVIRDRKRPLEWFAYASVSELTIDRRPLDALLHPLPVIEQTATKLEALQLLRTAGAAVGVVANKGRALGIVHYRGLAEQLFRPVTPGLPTAGVLGQ